MTFEPVQQVPFNLISFGSTSINVVAAGGSGEGEYTNWSNRYDVNADGFVSPIDILGIVNTLNKIGSGRLPGSNGEGEGGGKLYVDTNADGSLTPVDILGVINYLNSRRSGSGEGEGLVGEGEAPLAPGVESLVDAAVLSTDVLSVQIAETFAPKKTIGVRPLDQVQGPAYSPTNVADQWFAGEDEEFAQLLDDLATDERDLLA